MPPLIMEDRDSTRGAYHGLHLLQSPRRSLVQVELSETKRKQIVERKSLYERLEARRKVKFSIVKTAFLQDVPIASQMTDEEKNSLWWSAEQLQGFEEATNKISAAIPKTPRLGRKQEDEYLSVIERILDVCRETRKGKSKSVEHGDVKMLSDWHSSSLSKRGLESRLLNIKEHNDCTRENVLYSINVLRKNNKIEESAKSECIRACSERMTLPSRTFAKVLGDADKLASGGPKPQGRRSSTFLLGK